MSEVLKMTGTVHNIGEVETFDSGFSKRLLILEVVDGQYKNLHAFQATKDKTAMFDDLRVGQEATVCFNHSRCREYNGKWYTDPYSCWKVEAQLPATGSTPPDAHTPANPLDDDSIPF